jgi:hypothetical protein
MLVTFRTSAYADITMFGTAAVSLLKLMGHSGTVPGALLAADIPDALERLQAAIAAGGADTPERTEVADSDEDRDEDSDEDEPAPVPMATRAQPLLALLEAARDAGENVMWDE